MRGSERSIARMLKKLVVGTAARLKSGRRPAGFGTWQACKADAASTSDQQVQSVE